MTPGISLSQLSIKTRIETFSLLYFNYFNISLSQLSIKTRIETYHHVLGTRTACWFESAIH